MHLSKVSIVSNVELFSSMCSSEFKVCSCGVRIVFENLFIMFNLVHELLSVRDERESGEVRERADRAP